MKLIQMLGDVIVAKHVASVMTDGCDVTLTSAIPNDHHWEYTYDNEGLAQAAAANAVRILMEVPE